MNSIIKNEFLEVVISSFGAEIMSIKSNDGIEYLWQGNPSIWDGRSPVLFPYIGRLTNGKYKIDDKEYSMQIHGLAKYYEHEIKEKTDDLVVYEFKSNEETKKQYPRDFVFRVTYKLIKNHIDVGYEVKNIGSKNMYFGVGGHPGFNVPLVEEKKFEDYYLVFENAKNIQKVCFSDACFPTGKYEDFELDDMNRLHLNHNLFDHDAIVLRNTGEKVALICDSDKHKVIIKYDGIKYLGIWHKPKVEAQYVCIEPWCTLPSRDGVVENLETQPDLLVLLPDNIYNTKWSIEVE